MLLPGYRLNKVFAASLSIALTLCLQSSPDTVQVNDHPRNIVPLKLSSTSSTLVELAYPTYHPEPIQAPRKPHIYAPGVPSGRSSSLVWAEVGRYRLRLAESVEDRDAACRLRFKVFNIELKEGLERSYQTGMDSDHFDLFCEHLLVEDKTRAIRRAASWAHTGCNPARLPRATWATTRSVSSASLRMSRCAKVFWNWAAPPLTANIAHPKC